MSILNDSNLRYHGIGENLIKLIGIMKNGILCQKDSQKATEYQKNYGGYNKPDMVSLAVAIEGEHTNYGAFEVFIKNGISFVIKNSKGILASKTSHDSGIPGEEFHIGSIPKENIVGIMASKKIMRKRIRDLNLVRGMGTGYIDSTLLGLMKYFSVNGNSNVDIEAFEKILEQKEELLKRESEFFKRMNLEKKINERLSSYVAKEMENFFKSKFGKNTEYVGQVVLQSNRENYPIYDEHGEQYDLDKMMKGIEIDDEL